VSQVAIVAPNEGLPGSMIPRLALSLGSMNKGTSGH
jgi:hypothetical protein